MAKVCFLYHIEFLLQIRVTEISFIDRISVCYAEKSGEKVPPCFGIQPPPLPNKLPSPLVLEEGLTVYMTQIVVKKWV